MEPVHVENQANSEIINFLTRGGAHGHNSPTNMTEALSLDEMLKALQLQQQQDYTMPQAPAPYQHPFRQMTPQMQQFLPPRRI